MTTATAPTTITADALELAISAERARSTRVWNAYAASTGRTLNAELTDGFASDAIELVLTRFGLLDDAVVSNSDDGVLVTVGDIKIIVN